MSLFAQRYDIQPPPLGSGSFGTVWRAIDTFQNIDVALKVFGPGFSPALVFREAALLSSFSKLPHCLEIFNADKYHDIPYIATEVAGGSLADRLSGTFGVTISEAIAWTRAMLVGLKSCHQAGYLHRDVKPGNVFLMPGNAVKLGDFGLLERLAGGVTPWAGTQVYLPPESVTSGSPLTLQADIYGCGLVLRELLTGRQAFSHATSTTVVGLVTAGLELTRDVAPHVPRTLAKVVECATHMDPARRYESAQAMHEALGRVHRPRRDWEEVRPVKPEVRRWEALVPGGLALRVTVTPTGSAMGIETRQIGGSGRRVVVGCVENVPQRRLNVELRRVFDKI